MNTSESQASRPQTLIAAALYLMTHYARTGCPTLALCISKHLQCIAVHPDADPVIRDICAGMHGAWAAAAGENVVASSEARMH